MGNIAVDLDSLFNWSWRMDIEKDLLDAFDRIVHEDFPNPQRINCPERQLLLELAQHPADNRLSDLLAHIRHCAPCFDELKEVRNKAPNRAPQSI